NRDFYNTFESKDQEEFFRQLGTFTLLAVLYIVNGVYRQYFQQMLMIEWRAWMTENYLADWLKDRAYYRLQLLEGHGQPGPADRRRLEFVRRPDADARAGSLVGGGDAGVLHRHPMGHLRCSHLPRHRDPGLHGVGGADLRHRRNLADAL